MHSKKTYLDCFFSQPTRGKRKGFGLRFGFPMTGKCAINRDCKIKAIKDFYKNIQEPYMQYIGIAIDETVRLDRVIKSDNQMSLLQTYGYTEEMAKAKCKEYGLLSPIYKFTNRGGCWFCPNAREKELRHLRTNYRELWNELLKLENEPNLIGSEWNTLKKIKIHDWEQHFRIEDAQISMF